MFGRVLIRLFIPVKGKRTTWNDLRFTGTWSNSCRRTWAHAFSDNAMHDIEGYVISNFKAFCNSLVSAHATKEGVWGEPKNMSSMANYLTFDILASLCFGQESIRMLTKQDHHNLIDSIFRNAWRCMIVRDYDLYKHSLVKMLTLPIVWPPSYHPQTWVGQMDLPAPRK